MLRTSVEADTMAVLKAFAEARGVASAEHRMSSMLSAGDEVSTTGHNTVIRTWHRLKSAGG